MFYGEIQGPEAPKIPRILKQTRMEALAPRLDGMFTEDELRWALGRLETKKSAKPSGISAEEWRLACKLPEFRQ